MTASPAPGARGPRVPTWAFSRTRVPEPASCSRRALVPFPETQFQGYRDLGVCSGDSRCGDIVENLQ